MKRYPHLFTLLALTVFSACSSNEIGESKDVNQDKIYLQYYISHTEGAHDVDVKCTFRFAGQNGTTLVLSPGSSVELDGEKMKADSGFTSGAYYKIRKPIGSFYGNHTIRFTDINGRKFENSFNFDPVSLNIPPEADRKKDLRITYRTGVVGRDDYFDVHHVDTAGYFRYSLPVKDSAIVIPAKDLLAVKGDVLEFDCSLVRDVMLQQRTPEGGILTISQVLRPVRIKLLP